MNQLEKHMREFVEMNIDSIQEGRRFYREQVIYYFHNLSLISGGVISISIGLLPIFIERTPELTSQYKWLLVIGIILMGVCIILGQLNRLFYGEWIATSGNNEVLREFDRVDNEESKKSQEDYRRENWLWFISRATQIILPIIFVFGLGLICAYFFSLAFDF